MRKCVNQSEAHLGRVSVCFADNANIFLFLPGKRRDSKLSLDTSHSDLCANSFLASGSQPVTHTNTRTHTRDERERDSIMKLKITVICCNGSDYEAGCHFSCCVLLKILENEFFVAHRRNSHLISVTAC